MIVIIDNYDSFVFNLARYFEELGTEIRVFRNDEITITEIEKLNPEALVISPGPCTPAEAGISVQAIQKFYKSIPILGVCLGHQAIGVVFGQQTIRAQRPMHGKTSLIKHDQQGILEYLPIPLTVARYHSLVVDPVDVEATGLKIHSVSDEGDIMAFSHQDYPVYGVQFHPEAILTQEGQKIIKNFLRKVRLFWQKKTEEI